MSASEQSETCVRNFIEKIWNQHDLGCLPEYLHSEFIDHSIPFRCFQNVAGFATYLKKMNEDIFHNTLINELITVGDFVLVDVKIRIVPRKSSSAEEINAEHIHGFRVFKLSNGKIKGHWEFLD